MRSDEQSCCWISKPESKECRQEACKTCGQVFNMAGNAGSGFWVMDKWGGDHQGREVRRRRSGAGRYVCTRCSEGMGPAVSGVCLHVGSASETSGDRTGGF